MTTDERWEAFRVARARHGLNMKTASIHLAIPLLQLRRLFRDPTAPDFRRPNPDVAARIAAFVGIGVDELFPAGTRTTGTGYPGMVVYVCPECQTPLRHHDTNRARQTKIEVHELSKTHQLAVRRARQRSEDTEPRPHG
jgi:hypothetical protein